VGSCDSEEECRNLVAECLGRLALLYPARVLAELQVGARTTHATADLPAPRLLPCPPFVAFS
jgi:cullin-associated NEDD8-dissociated protein 1